MVEKYSASLLRNYLQVTVSGIEPDDFNIWSILMYSQCIT